MKVHSLATGYISLNNHRLFLTSKNCNLLTESVIVILPPFAEEMNKCRHLISNLMRQLADAGVSSFLLDNFGTGDSEGDLDEASLQLWREDLAKLLQEISTQGYRDISFIAIRLGALQLFDLLNNIQLPLPINKVVLWQPFFDMAKFWQQFVRIKVAEAMASGDKISQKQLEQQLNVGEILEIAGYPISPTFYQSLLNANAAFPVQLSATPVYWLETSQLDNIAVPVEKMRQQLQAHCVLQFEQIKGEPYWQTTELAQASTLISRTLASMLAETP